MSSQGVVKAGGGTAVPGKLCLGPGQSGTWRQTGGYYCLLCPEHDAWGRKMSPVVGAEARGKWSRRVQRCAEM